MRVRAFFWVLLAASCIGVLLFAAAYKAHAPAVMHVHIDQQWRSSACTISRNSSALLSAAA